MVFSREGGYSPFWHPSGRELFFIADDPRPATLLMMAVDFTSGTSRRVGTPKLLFEFNPRLLDLSHTPAAAFDLTGDGQSFYAVQHSTPPPHPVVTHINLIPNWFEELKAKVPARQASRKPRP